MHFTFEDAEHNKLHVVHHGPKLLLKIVPHLVIGAEFSLAPQQAREIAHQLMHWAEAGSKGNAAWVISDPPATWHYHNGLIGPTHDGRREDCRKCTPE